MISFNQEHQPPGLDSLQRPVLTTNIKMKNRNIFLIIILSTVSMFMIFSCDRTSDQHNQMLKPNDDVALVTRGDCDECPGDEECCCAVWLQPGAPDVSLQFCGTTNGLSACAGAATGSCPSFSGGGLFRTLDSGNPRKTFCVGESSPFYVRNLSGTTSANIIITCQADITPPDTMWLQIPPNGYKFVSTDDTCELSSCE